jgi:hypothetical protein
MTEEKKYATFADVPRGTMKGLRSVTPPVAPIVSPVEPSTSISSTTSTSRTTRSSSATSRPSTARKASIAPERDFTRVPNSVARHAVPERVFRGKSKQVYDYLWSVSRGAVIPSRSVRKSRKEIQKGSGLGSMVTVDAAIDHLQKAGMIRVRPAVGSLVGNEYEVYTYEESSTSSTSTSSTSSPTQNLVELVEPESSTTRRTQVFDSQDTSGTPNTSFKTNTEKLDDEAAPLRKAFFEMFERASKDLTGKEIGQSETSKYLELAEVLITELRIAAGRTTVSSVPAFLTEHLRRRLWKKEKRQLEEENRLEVAKQSSGSDVDASKCPDCFGTGMWYPEGFDKGVARCRHEKLTGEGRQGESNRPG